MFKANTTLVAIIIFACFGTANLAIAQLTVTPNSGCSDGSMQGSPIEATNDESPTVGNLSFSLTHACAAGADAAFIVIGAPTVGPLVDWNLADPCFANWTSVPATCGQSHMLLYDLQGSFARNGKMIFPFPIPNLPGLVAFTAANPLCFQFVCINTSLASPCVSISAGAELRIL